MQIENVSGTAFVVAEFRAEENGETAPLYHDAVVKLFLSEDSKRAARRVSNRFPSAGDLVRIRTKYFDDTLEKQLHSRTEQVVILGAGLDTRAVRKAMNGVRYFEIDDPATLEVKRACYEEHGLDVNVTLIPGNYATDGMVDLLKAHDFDVERPTYVIWEGNTMYLSTEDVRRIPAELRANLRRFRVSFDYMAESVIDKTTGDPGVTALVESFADMGAPWRSGIPDIYGFARELGLRVVDNHPTSELHRNYWRGRPMVSPIFNFYSVCTLEPAQA